MYLKKMTCLPNYQSTYIAITGKELCWSFSKPSHERRFTLTMFLRQNFMQSLYNNATPISQTYVDIIQSLRKQNITSPDITLLLEKAENEDNENISSCLRIAHGLGKWIHLIRKVYPRTTTSHRLGNIMGLSDTRPWEIQWQKQSLRRHYIATLPVDPQSVCSILWNSSRKNSKCFSEILILILPRQPGVEMLTIYLTFKNKGRDTL